MLGSHQPTLTQIFRVEETAIHKYHECPVVADEVWKPLARTWRETTGETVNTTSTLLTIAGLRLEPPGLDSATRAKWRALEPAWRLLHAIALLQIHRARGSVYAACHAQPRREHAEEGARMALVTITLEVFVECRINTNTRTYSHPGGRPRGEGLAPPLRKFDRRRYCSGHKRQPSLPIPPYPPPGLWGGMWTHTLPWRA